MDIIEVEKKNNFTLVVTHLDGTKEDFLVIKIISREGALKLLEKYTREALLKPNAFEKLGTFVLKRDYNRLRNYEIEDCLDELSLEFGHKIDEICPFNGFKWFD